MTSTFNNRNAVVARVGHMLERFAEINLRKPGFVDGRLTAKNLVSTRRLKTRAGRLGCSACLRTGQTKTCHTGILVVVDREF